MKRTLFQALRKQTAKIFGYAKIVVSAIFFSMKKGAKIETQSAGGGGAKPIVF